MLNAKEKSPQPNPSILHSMNVLVRGLFENMLGDATCGSFDKLMAEEPSAGER